MNLQQLRIVIETKKNSFNLTQVARALFTSQSGISKAIKELEDSKEITEAFGEQVIKSYVKLKNLEINDFFKEESFDKNSPVTDWEKNNTLDC